MVYRSESTEGGEKPQNAFRNDGSFLEMFKELQEKAKKEGKEKPPNKLEPPIINKVKTSTATTTESPRPERKTETPKTETSPSSSGPSLKLLKSSSGLPFVGKRRGGRVLPTGKVKKAKCGESAKETTPTDAWSLYLAEVKRYKETTCEEDGKTRPLVK